MREEPADIADELANKLGIYGGQCDEDTSCPTDVYSACRSCFVCEMSRRIIQAVEVHQALNDIKK